MTSHQPYNEPPSSFWRDARGSAAVEFAVLLPLLTLMLLATIEIGRAVNTYRHFNSATATVGDLVAREEYLGQSTTSARSNLEGMMRSIQHLMEPYETSTLKLGVFSVRASLTDASDTRVEWQYSYNGMNVPSKCQTYQLPPNLIDKGGSVIVVESSYGFTPLFGGFVPGFKNAMTWQEKTFHSPRNSCVDYVKGDNCSSLNC